MFEIIVKILFVLFALVGIAELFRMFLFWLLKTKNQGELYLVLSVKGHDEEVEISLRSALERVKWMRGSEVRLLCVDCGMDEETRRICDIMAEEYPEILFCYPEELPKIICL